MIVRRLIETLSQDYTALWNIYKNLERKICQLIHPAPDARKAGITVHPKPVFLFMYTTIPLLQPCDLKTKIYWQSDQTCNAVPSTSVVNVDRNDVIAKLSLSLNPYRQTDRQTD
jgi:hypothetical protein